MKKKGRWITAIFGLVFVGLLGVAAWFIFAGDSAGKKNDEVPADLVAQAVRRDIETKLLLTGEISPAFSVEVKSEISGKVKELHVSTGEFVERGAPLVTIDDTDLMTERQGAKTEVQGARLEVDKRRGNYERAKSLFEEKLISKEVFSNLQSDLLIAENSFVRAQARLQTVDDKLSKTRIMAPATGTVLSVPVTEGQVVVGATSVNNGTVLLSFADLKRLMIDTHVNQMDINNLKIGDYLYIQMQGEEEPVRAKVEFIAPVASVKNNIKGFAVQGFIESNDPRLRPGMSLSLELPVAHAKEAISVPIAAVFTDQNEKVVYVRSGGELQRRTVRVGLSNFSFAEITDGLEEGEEILLIQPKELTGKG